MKIIPLIVLLLTFTSSYSQISSEDADKTVQFENKFAPKIDSSRALSGNCRLTYSHDTLFNCIHMTNSSGKIHLISAEYPENVRTDFIADFDSVLLFRLRADGSCNPSFFFLTNKKSGSGNLMGWGEFPIHIDLAKQLIVYFKGNTMIHIRNLKTNRLEDYALTHMQTACEGGYDVISLTDSVMTLKYTDEQGKSSLVKVDRK